MKANELRKLLGKNVRKVRKSKELTQEQLSEKSGVAYKYIQEIEAGRANITLETIAKLCKTLSIKPLILFDPKNS